MGAHTKGRLKLDRQKILRLLGGYPVQVPSPYGLLEFEAEMERWQPLKKIPMTKGIAAVHAQIGMDPADMEVWANNTYEVFVKPMTENGKAGPVHLSVKRYDRMPVHNWRHLQQMKNEIVGEFREALELYPGEHRIADNANQTHLWVMEEGTEIPVGFPTGFALTDEQVERFNANGSKARQEPQQPGLTTGDQMRQAIAEGTTDPATQAAFERVLDGGGA